MYPGNIVFSNSLCWMTGMICRFSFLCVNGLKGNEELLPLESWRQPHEIPPCISCISQPTQYLHLRRAHISAHPYQEFTLCNPW